MSRIVKEPEERKEELLQIGIRLFLQDGIKNMSIQNVVNEANVATGLFYYYFKTKDDFIDQVLERHVYDYVIGFEEIVNDKNTSILNRLDLILKQFHIRFSEIGKLNYDELLDYPQHFALVEDLIIKRAHGTLVDFIKEGKENGYFHVLEPDITGLFMIYGLVGVIPRASFFNDDSTNEEIRRLVFATLSVNDKNRNEGCS